MLYTDNSDGGTGNKGTIALYPNGGQATSYYQVTLRNTGGLKTPFINHDVFEAWHHVAVTFGATNATLYRFYK